MHSYKIIIILSLLSNKKGFVLLNYETNFSTHVKLLHYYYYAADHLIQVFHSSIRSHALQVSFTNGDNKTVSLFCRPTPMLLSHPKQLPPLPDFPTHTQTQTPIQSFIDYFSWLPCCFAIQIIL